MEDWEGEDVWLGTIPPSAPTPAPLSPASPTHPQSALIRPGIAAVPGIISVAMLHSLGTHPVQPSAAQSSFQALDHSSCLLTLPSQTTTLSSLNPLSSEAGIPGAGTFSKLSAQDQREHPLVKADVLRTPTGLLVYPEAYFLLQSLPSARSATLLSLPRPLALRSPLAGMLLTLSHCGAKPRLPSQISLWDQSVEGEMSFSHNQWARGAIDAPTLNLSTSASRSDRPPNTVDCVLASCRRPYGLVPGIALGDADSSRVRVGSLFEPAQPSPLPTIGL